MLSLDHITVRIGSSTLLHDATTAVQPGRLTAVVGANGAGKTTLLRVACGEHVPTTGRVTMDEVPLDRLSTAAQARRRAVLPQHARLGFAFPVFEVVLMGRTPHTHGAARDAEIAAAALETVAMTPFADRAYPTLSGGEKQRVHLARALAQVWEPPPGGHRYLLLDEPTASLDLAHQHGVLRTARSFAEQGAGVLAVLHDLNLAAQYAHHVVVLAGGTVLEQGSPSAVLTPEVIQAAFDIPVRVQPHPCRECPLVISAPDGPRSSMAALSAPSFNNQPTDP